MPTRSDRRPRRRLSPKLAIAVLAVAQVLAAAQVLAGPAPGSAEEPAPRPGVAMHGSPALLADFDHLPYANPDAPKGGRVTYGWLGAFETLNPFGYRGKPAQGLKANVYESLLARSYDEPFSLYGLIAESVELPDDRSSITFHLNPKARFSDGEAITADDVLFTFELLRERGHPSFRANYRRVRSASVEDERTIRFDLTGSEDREMPLILGLMPVLPRHATAPATFEETSFTPLVGSGPYVVSAVAPGRAVTFRRDPNYWGADLPVNRGLNNFDEIRYDYYRDANALFEAFKAGLVDVLPESDPIRWTTGYDFPAVRNGDVVKDELKTGLPWGMSAFVFNTRKPLFADIRVREALGALFDYAWIDRNLYAGATVRTSSYYEGSELASTGHAADARERELLAPFPGVVRPDVLNGTWRPPASDGSGRDRDQLRRALDLLAEAGWTVRDGELRDAAGAPFRFEILVSDKDYERLSLAFSSALERAGIRATVRLVDSTQAFRRLQTYDFDMIPYKWVSTLSPGAEQKKYWSAAAADTPGERNYIGVKQPAVDAMIEALLAARDRPDFVSAARALDRVLLSGFYVVPLFHLKDQWIGRWRRIERPDTTPLYGAAFETWWRAPASTDRPRH